MPCSTIQLPYHTIPYLVPCHPISSHTIHCVLQHYSSAVSNGYLEQAEEYIGVDGPFVRLVQHHRHVTPAQKPQYPQKKKTETKKDHALYTEKKKKKKLRSNKTTIEQHNLESITRNSQS